ncbi:thioredoxin family protein [Spirosoma aerolatum]|uniref:thioredoxin family protein n=1 Tax=Spirosoma aerolatum TaxID=1211326 RepID=UPI0009AF0FAA|nr:thioredoxin family protein [Spirosoma aerolatum]
MVPYSSVVATVPQVPVLLVFTSSSTAQRTDVDQLLDKMRSVLYPNVQIMRVNESSHPEVVRSFGVTSLPAFVLLKRGLELWRYAGPVDHPDLVNQLETQLIQTSTK